MRTLGELICVTRPLRIGMLSILCACANGTKAITASFKGEKIAPKTSLNKSSSADSSASVSASTANNSVENISAAAEPSDKNSLPSPQSYVKVEPFEPLDLQPFSFTYGGVPFSQGGWRVASSTGSSTVYHDATGVLEARFEVTEMREFNANKWHLTLKNISTTAVSALIENVNAGDIKIDSAVGDTNNRFSIVYHVGALGENPNDGSNASPFPMADFTPINNNPPPGIVVNLEPMNGRSSSGVMPYFSVASPNREKGAVFAVGWTGHWRSGFDVDPSGKSLRFTAGQKHFSLQLRPGESVRTPSILMMKWKALDQNSVQNRFRRLMLEKVFPRDRNGKLPEAVAAASFENGLSENKTAAQLKNAISFLATQKLGFNIFWNDAGWYPVVTPAQDSELFNFLSTRNSLWVSGVGDWIPDARRFPNGYEEVSDAAHASGLKSLLWFEPERVAQPSSNFSLFSSSSRILQSHITNANEVKLFGTVNFSDGGVVNSMIDTMDARIKSMRLDYFRQDMNGGGPLQDWLLNDANQSRGMNRIARVGATEAGYIMGLYRFWDELRLRNPSLVIDNCAGGGRRLDFEALSRTVPFWRSDRAWDPAEEQNQMLGLSSWIPLQGRGSDSAASSPQHLKYKIRSGFGWSTVFAFPWSASISPAMLTVLKSEIGLLRGTETPLLKKTPLTEIFKGDFYPVTYGQKLPIGNWAGSAPTYLSNDIWVGWQFFRSDLQVGLVQGFRRSANASAQFKMNVSGLDAGKTYRLIDVDTGNAQNIAGGQLLNTGISMSCVDANQPFCARLFLLEAVN